MPVQGTGGEHFADSCSDEGVQTLQSHALNPCWHAPWLFLSHRNGEENLGEEPVALVPKRGCDERGPDLTAVVIDDGFICPVVRLVRCKISVFGVGRPVVGGQCLCWEVLGPDLRLLQRVSVKLLKLYRQFP